MSRGALCRGPLPSGASQAKGGPPKRAQGSPVPKAADRRCGGEMRGGCRHEGAKTALAGWLSPGWVRVGMGAVGPSQAEPPPREGPRGPSGVPRHGSAARLRVGGWVGGRTGGWVGRACEWEWGQWAPPSQVEPPLPLSEPPKWAQGSPAHGRGRQPQTRERKAPPMEMGEGTKTAPGGWLTPGWAGTGEQCRRNV